MFALATLLDEFSMFDPGDVHKLVPAVYIAGTYDQLVHVDPINELVSYRTLKKQ